MSKPKHDTSPTTKNLPCRDLAAELCEACRSRDRNAVEALIAEGRVNPSQPDDQHMDPLTLAIEHRCIEIVIVLICAGAFIDKWMLPKAIIRRDIDIVIALLRAGADVRVGGYKPPLHCAVADGYMPIIELLLRAGAPVNALCPYTQETALHHAIWHNQPQAAIALIKAGADPTIRTGFGKTAMDMALKQNLDDVVAALRTAGMPGPGACCVFMPCTHSGTLPVTEMTHKITCPTCHEVVVSVVVKIPQ